MWGVFIVIVFSVINFVSNSVAISSPTNSYFEKKIQLSAEAQEIETDFSWNAVTFFSISGKDLPQIEYFSDDRGDFHVWETAHMSGHEVNHKRNDLLELLYFDNSRKNLIVRSEFPVDIYAHFFHTRNSLEDLVSSLTRNALNYLGDGILPESLKIRNTKEPQFFSRSQWGADESLRVVKGFKKFFPFRRWFSVEEKKVSLQYKPVVITRKNSQGESLFWPISEQRKIAKFVIHHTGEAVQNKYSFSPKALMRAIYYYHTITKSWGDIGYNYVIDSQGNIYEGRAGSESGKMIVGAHTAFRNIGTVGIALMGNLENNLPTEAQLNMLAFLIADFSRGLQVRPLNESEFMGKSTPNLLGHRDIAIAGHATKCPGKNLIAAFPTIRKKVTSFLKILEKYREENLGLRGLNFLQKSSLATAHLQSKKDLLRKQKEQQALKEPFSLVGFLNPEIFIRGESKPLTLKIKNHSDKVWKKGDFFSAFKYSSGIEISNFIIQSDARPEETTTIVGKLLPVKLENGIYSFSLYPTFLKGKIFRDILDKSVISIPFQVSGSKKLILQKKPSEKKNKKFDAKNFFYGAVEKKTESISVPKIRVKLADFDYLYAEIISSDRVGVFTENKKLMEIEPLTSIKVFQREKGKIEFLVRGKNTEVKNLSLKTAGILKIKNYRNKNFGSGDTKYNTFRRQLNFWVEGDKMIIVNELPIEEYLYGLGEEPASEPEQKKLAIFILARSYALVYSTYKNKFESKYYDLEDSPRSSQLYLGETWEKNHIEQKELVKKTRGIVLFKNKKPIIGPYFTQSDGRSRGKWLTQYPWVRVRDLPLDQGLELRGHGVGLSGNSARILAQQGKSYLEIFDYFFDNVTTKKVY